MAQRSHYKKPKFKRKEVEEKTISVDSVLRSLLIDKVTRKINRFEAEKAVSPLSKSKERKLRRLRLYLLRDFPAQSIFNIQRNTYRKKYYQDRMNSMTQPLISVAPKPVEVKKYFKPPTYARAVKLPEQVVVKYEPDNLFRLVGHGPYEPREDDWSWGKTKKKARRGKRGKGKKKFLVEIELQTIEKNPGPKGLFTHFELFEFPFYSEIIRLNSKRKRPQRSDYYECICGRSHNRTCPFFAHVPNVDTSFKNFNQDKSFQNIYNMFVEMREVSTKDYHLCPTIIYWTVMGKIGHYFATWYGDHGPYLFVRIQPSIEKPIQRQREVPKLHYLNSGQIVVPTSTLGVYGVHKSFLPIDKEMGRFQIPETPNGVDTFKRFFDKFSRTNAIWLSDKAASVGKHFAPKIQELLEEDLPFDRYKGLDTMENESIQENEEESTEETKQNRKIAMSIEPKTEYPSKEIQQNTEIVVIRTAGDGTGTITSNQSHIVFDDLTSSSIPIQNAVKTGFQQKLDEAVASGMEPLIQAPMHNPFQQRVDDALKDKNFIKKALDPYRDIELSPDQLKRQANIQQAERDVESSNKEVEKELANRMDIDKVFQKFQIGTHSPSNLFKNTTPKKLDLPLADYVKLIEKEDNDRRTHNRMVNEITHQKEIKAVVNDDCEIHLEETRDNFSYYNQIDYFSFKKMISLKKSSMLAHKYVLFDTFIFLFIFSIVTTLANFLSGSDSSILLFGLLQSSRVFSYNKDGEITSGMVDKFVIIILGTFLSFAVQGALWYFYSWMDNYLISHICPHLTYVLLKRFIVHYPIFFYNEHRQHYVAEQKIRDLEHRTGKTLKELSTSLNKKENLEKPVKTKIILEPIPTATLTEDLRPALHAVGKAMKTNAKLTSMTEVHRYLEPNIDMKLDSLFKYHDSWLTFLGFGWFYCFFFDYDNAPITVTSTNESCIVSKALFSEICGMRTFNKQEELEILRTKLLSASKLSATVNVDEAFNDTRNFIYSNSFEYSYHLLKFHYNTHQIKSFRLSAQVTDSFFMVIGHPKLVFQRFWKLIQLSISGLLMILLLRVDGMPLESALGLILLVLQVLFAILETRKHSCEAVRNELDQLCHPSISNFSQNYLNSTTCSCVSTSLIVLSILMKILA